MKKLAASLHTPSILWIMVPHFVADTILEEVPPLLDKGDIIMRLEIYKEAIRRYNDLKELGISFMDAGTSCGMKAARNGACYIIGGDSELGNR